MSSDAGKILLRSRPGSLSPLRKKHGSPFSIHFGVDKNDRNPGIMSGRSCRVTRLQYRFSGQLLSGRCIRVAQLSFSKAHNHASGHVAS